ncbi:hypothetical protein B0H16DRAFT_1452607 [Mycena metata]|uniref:Uncharacterized protein n=1 Tax=Mycena metata TaxID=1033252 RepID=A0AAD7JTV5_9AGAR|nr:hypothetical protein B0H16DRAFT_1452607 [Mycena metata]
MSSHVSSRAAPVCLLHPLPILIPPYSRAQCTFPRPTLGSAPLSRPPSTSSSLPPSPGFGLRLREGQPMSAPTPSLRAPPSLPHLSPSLHDEAPRGESHGMPTVLAGSRGESREVEEREEFKVDSLNLLVVRFRTQGKKYGIRRRVRVRETKVRVDLGFNSWGENNAAKRALSKPIGMEMSK